MFKKRFILLLSLCFISLVACKNDKNSAETSIDPEILKQDSIQLTLNSDDKMKFDQKELVVGEGQMVTLTLHHTGKMSKETMGHNFVLLDQGVNPSKFSQRATQAKDNDYIPESDKIIAHTKLIGGGESTEITFKAPKKGSYDFLCTFPGHYASMRGKFIVQ